MHKFGDIVTYTKPGPEGPAIMNALVFRAQMVPKTTKKEDEANLVEELSLVYMHPNSFTTAGSGNLKQFVEIDYGVRESEGDGKLGWNDAEPPAAAPSDSDAVAALEQQNSGLTEKVAELEAKLAAVPTETVVDGGSGTDSATSDQH